jgi:hypothetical protein
MTRLTLADDVATVTAGECLLDVTLHVDRIEVTLTVRAKVDALEYVTWTPERILCACWNDGEEIVPDRAFCSAEWELRLREHNRQIETWVREWVAREDHDLFRERGLRMLGLAS